MRTAEAPSDAPNETENASEPLANARHERFAVMVASGNVTVAEAYRCAVSERGSTKTSWENGCKLAAKVAPRIEWMKREVAKRFKCEAEKAILNMAEKRRICAEIARTGENRDRLAAIKVDNDLAGDGAEASGNKALGELVKRLRK